MQKIKGEKRAGKILFIIYIDKYNDELVHKLARANDDDYICKNFAKFYKQWSDK